MSSPRADAVAKLTILIGTLAAESQRRREPESTYVDTLVAMRDYLHQKIINIEINR